MPDSIPISAWRAAQEQWNREDNPALIYGIGRSDMEGVVTYHDPTWAAGQVAAQVESVTGRDFNLISSGFVEGMKPGDKLSYQTDGITFWIECKAD